MEETTVKIPTFKDLMKLSNFYNIQYIENRIRESVFYDPSDFTYKFVRCTYEKNRKRKFNHINIREESFEDSKGKDKGKDKLISAAIDKLKENKCYEWDQDLSEFKKIDECELCKKNNSI